MPSVENLGKRKHLEKKEEVPLILMHGEKHK